jgi:hypothetical protein
MEYLELWWIDEGNHVLPGALRHAEVSLKLFLRVPAVVHFATGVEQWLWWSRLVCTVQYERRAQKSKIDQKWSYRREKDSKWLWRFNQKSSDVPVVIMLICSGGGYCSEAISFVMGLSQRKELTLQISQHGDSFSWSFSSGLTENVIDTLSSLMVPYFRRYSFRNHIVICHSEPGN